MSEPICGTGERRVQVCPVCWCDAPHTKMVGIYWGTVLWWPLAHRAACGRWCIGSIDLDYKNVPVQDRHPDMERCETCKVHGGQKASASELEAARVRYRRGPNGKPAPIAPVERRTFYVEVLRDDADPVRLGGIPSLSVARSIAVDMLAYGGLDGSEPLARRAPLRLVDGDDNTVAYVFDGRGPNNRVLARVKERP